MDTTLSSSPQFVAKSTLTAALPQVDQRPSADSLAVNTRAVPDIPFPIPATLAPLAQVAQAKLDKQSQGGKEFSTNHVERSQRVLKPFGITMLPYEELTKGAADHQHRGTAHSVKAPEL